MPVILMNTSIEKWRARRLWSPKYISENTDMLYNIQMHKDKIFYYFHTDRPLSSLPSIQQNYKQITYERVNMTAKQFFDVIRPQDENGSKSPYYYYAATADTLGRPYNDLYPVEPLMVRTSSWTPDTSYLHRWTNVWFGPAGVTTHTHYDISHNFYAQLNGKKRFILLAPDQAKNLYLYPALHPGAQQSQVRFENPDYQTFPRFKQAKALEAVLQPGDLLYLPPLWFHHVTALTNSMSVSVWTRYQENQDMYATISGALPFRRTWPKEKIYTAGRVVLRMLLNAFEVEEEDEEGLRVDLYSNYAKEIVKELIATRYQPLFDSVPGFLKPNPHFDKSAPKEKSISFCSKDLLPQKEEDFLTESEDGILIQSFIAKEHHLIRSVDNLARREIWLHNLIEHISLGASSEENVGNFLLDFTRC
jgi:hypothetical protein